MSCAPTSCLLQTGKGSNCRTTQGGGLIREILLQNKCAVTPVVDATTNIVTDFTFIAPATGWYRATSLLDTGAVNETLNNPQAKAIIQTLVVQFSALSDNPDPVLAAAEAIEFFNALKNSDQDFYAIVTPRSGIRYLLGYQGDLKVTEGDNATGTAATDVASNTLTFVSVGPDYAKPILASYTPPIAPNIVFSTP